MSSLGLLSPLANPFKFSRESSSAPTSTSMDSHIHNIDPFSSPLPTSRPLLAPLHLTRRNECAEWQLGNDFDNPDGAAYNHQLKFEKPWPRRANSLSYVHPPLPSLMSKFASHVSQSDAPLSYSSSPFSYASTTHLYPQGDSAIADDCEEYDLESMDIHIRETYFATSAERGRWLSSPIAPRVRSQAVPPMRGHSSPAKPLAGASPLRERLGRHRSSHSVDEQILTSSSEDRDDIRCSSPLPPSSPLTSPMSNLSFLSDDGEDDSVVDARSNSDDLHSLIGTPELSISSTTCTSPIEPTRPPTSHEAPASILAHQPSDFPCHPTSSVISRYTSSCPPKSTDVHIPAPSTTDFEPLSPLSQFELDLPEVEPQKLPLSDTVNKPYPGLSLDAECNQDVSRSPRSLSIDPGCGPVDPSQDNGGCKRKAERRGTAAGNSGARRTRKRAVVKSENPSSDAKKRRGSEGRSSNHPESLCKRSKLSHPRDDFESQDGVSKAMRLSQSPSCTPAAGCNSESTCPRIQKPTRQTQLRQSTPSPSTKPVSLNAVDSEFHASLTGMLIEALATSRATSMNASALYLVLKQTHPYLVAERSRAELLVDIGGVLEAGRIRCGMFEKVDCSGERTRDKALESRWFYVPERDEDRERASLISAVMPRQKRNETKKYKQYYYRPLDKISRWDPEDAP